MNDRLLFSLAGILSGLTVPFGWFLWRAFTLRKNWWMTFVSTEWSRHYEIYICLGSFAVGVFGILGYWFGKKNDDLRQLSKTVENSNYSLSQLATTDGLTGLFNSRYIHERLDHELELAYRSPLSCLLIDIDHFKRINDGFGHPFGDEVLILTAQILKRSVRRIDAVGRLGGEEFVVVLPGTPADRAEEIADRIRQAVEQAGLTFEEKPVRFTVSIGIVTCPAPGLQYRQGLLKAVDEALYSAKRAGRNRVVAWKSPSNHKNKFAA